MDSKKNASTENATDGVLSEIILREMNVDIRHSSAGIRTKIRAVIQNEFGAKWYAGVIPLSIRLNRDLQSDIIRILDGKKQGEK